jgi:hypothetical protein
MVDQVIDEIKRADTSITAVVQQEILNAIEHYSTFRFWFNEASTTLTTSSSLAYYAWPADFLEPISVTVQVSGSRYEVSPINYADLNALDIGRTFSYPERYANFNQQFRFYPVPNGSYTIIVDYQKRLPTLSLTSDSNGWTNYANELIQARAEKQLYAKRYKEQDKAQMCAMVEEEAFQRLMNLTDRTNSSGRISPD